MFFKSINILTFTVSCLFLTSCYQDLVEKNYSSDTPGYSSPKLNMKQRNDNRFVNQDSKFRNQNPDQIPVILTDPFAAGINNSGFNSQYNSFNQARPNSSAYGSLNNAENNVIRNDVLIQNNSPVFPQPAFGSNIYSPYRSR